MHFRPKAHAKGVLAGHIIDDKSRQIEVRFDADGYYCQYGDTELRAKDPESLVEEYSRVMGFIKDWKDVIMVTIRKDTQGTCPPSLMLNMSFEPMHIAKNSAGDWVSAEWSPEVLAKRERRMSNNVSISRDTELELPCKVGSGYCNSGTEIILLPYSEIAVSNLKAQQTEFMCKAEEIVDLLLRS